MRDSIAIVFAGSGGAGAITAGGMFLQAAARGGYYGLMTKLSGAQVRGGEAAALVEVGVAPLEAQLATYGLGFLPEIADGDPPHTARGCPFQAWSLGELLRMRQLVAPR